MLLRPIRSATLFGAIIPTIKAETTAIRRDLAQLKSVRASLTTAQKDLKIESQGLDTVRAELKVLLEHKKSFVRKSRSQLELEQKRTAQLVAKAKNLNQLLAKIKENKKSDRKIKTTSSPQIRSGQSSAIAQTKNSFFKNHRPATVTRTRKTITWL